jgi:hypothetical protein
VNKTSRMIARALKQIKPPQGEAVFRNGVRRGVELSAHALADALAREYPVFDETKFLLACGVGPRKRTDAEPGQMPMPP